VRNPVRQQASPGWRRVAAFGADYSMIAVWVGVLGLIGLLLRATGVAPRQITTPAGRALGQLLAFAALNPPVSLWFAAWEAAPRGATPGKRLLGLRVLSPDGDLVGVGGAAVPESESDEQAVNARARASTALGLVVAGLGVASQPGDRDGVQGAVEVAVPATVDSLGRLGCQAGVWLMLTMVSGTSRLRVGKVASCPASCCDLPCALSAM
jgi:hypothetical protein